MPRSESSIILFLVPRRKVWLTLTARMPCSNAANIGERKTWMQSEFCTWQNSVRGEDPQKYSVLINQSINQFLKWPKWHSHCKDHWLSDVSIGLLHQDMIAVIKNKNSSGDEWTWTFLRRHCTCRGQRLRPL